MPPADPDPTVVVVDRVHSNLAAGDATVTALNVDGRRHVALELPDEPLTRDDATNVAALLLQASTLH